MKPASGAVLLKRMPAMETVRGAGSEKVAGKTGKTGNDFLKDKKKRKKKRKTTAGGNHRSGTVPYLLDSDGTIRVMLVTPKGGGTWMLPKGNIEKGMTPYDSAAKGAFEEAGVTGDCDPVILGEYKWQSQLVSIYPLQIKRILDDWKETGLRSRFLFRLEMAMKAVKNDDIRTVLRKLKNYLTRKS